MTHILNNSLAVAFAIFLTALTFQQAVSIPAATGFASVEIA